MVKQFKIFLGSLLRGENLSSSEMQSLMTLIMTGELSSAQIASCIVAMQIKGETPDEIAAAASVMREHANKVIVDDYKYLIDTCGTGGDGMNTLNISTASALLLSSMGIKVAKHGNYSVSSQSGSSDMLESFGYNFTNDESVLREHLEKANICFLHAPKFHPAMKNVSLARKQLATRTAFNLLGPLSNPANVKNQLVGVFSNEFLTRLPHILKRKGVENIMTVRSNDGMDEFSTSSTNSVCILKNNIIESDELSEMVGADKGKLIPTDIGMIVNDFLVDNFENILDYNFTAQVEQSFDDIANGVKDWTEMLKGFYDQFHPTVVHVKENAQRESGERILGVDPKSGRSVKVRLGKFGPMAQIGDPEDDDKSIFASLGLNQQLESITFEEVMQLFEMPMNIGVFEDEEIVVNNGRFGPYIKHNSIFISLPKGMLPTEVDLDIAIQLIQEKQKADAPIYIYKELPVTKGVGRFGPFLKWSGIFINVNKNEVLQ